MQITVSDYLMEKHDVDSFGTSVYGFLVYNKDGKSLPKGFVSSYNAFLYKDNQPGSKEIIMIEFGIQSPTGDSSDHHHYSFPCLTWSQAKHLVDAQFNMVHAGLKEYGKLQLLYT